MAESRRVFLKRGALAALAFIGRPALGEEKPDNRALPAKESEGLLLHARTLFDAVVQGKPELADDFFFPREPFLALKDVADPGRYHGQLLSAYHHDVRALHGKRKSWEGATFRSFELGTVPRWVEPGREWNKIGYHRTYRAHLRYEVAGRSRTIEVHTIISWGGEWYVTHLLPIRH